jgi:3-methyladenine DNA glycosylase AlkD
MNVEAEHEALVAELRAAGAPYRNVNTENDSYTASGRPFFNVSVPERRRMARAWLAAHRQASDPQVLAFAGRLFTGESHEERTLGALLLGYSARARRAASLAMVEAWLGELSGWAEVDSFCASVFTADDLAVDWPAWRDLIRRLAHDANINKRRAALVLLVAPTRTSNDPRFFDLGFEVIDRLKGERDILITKAVSWLLRSMCGRRGTEVAAYVEINRAILPAIAVRETRIKLETGTKSGKPAKPRPSART